MNPVPIPNSELRVMRSEKGGEYQIMIARPSGPAPAEGFPAIYLLDANATFGTVVEAIRLRAARPDVTGVVPTAVIGIGYDTGGPYHRERRTFDFTAGPPAEPRLADRPGDPPGATGGADEFLHFIERKLKPEIGKLVAIDPQRQSLFGHSLGGFFVLRTFLTSPGSFNNYVAASPSIWWDKRALEEGTETLSARLEGGAGSPRVMLTVGEFEQKLSQWEIGSPTAEVTAERRRRRMMVDNTRDLAERLSHLRDPRVRVHFEEFAHEDHASAVLRTISSALRFVLAPPPQVEDRSTR
jgi:uncharacterized protein